MSLSRKLKEYYWKALPHFPYKLRYLLTWHTTKGGWPHLRSPQTYSEFIFRDNYYKRHDKHAFLADKYEVRKYVEERGLGDTLTKLYGVWDDANKINFDELPDRFALKCNHSCGMNIVCDDKSKLDISAVRKQLNEWLGMKHPEFFEHHYTKIKPLIICEEYLSDSDGNFPNDYKIHCVNGEPIYIQLCFGRTKDDVGKRVIYSLDWNDLHYVVQDYHYSEEAAPRPKALEEMIRDAAILSKGLDYARIDLYDLDGRVVFGEVTLTPMGGWLSYFTPEANKLMGDKIRENLKKQGRK